MKSKTKKIITISILSVSIIASLVYLVSQTKIGREGFMKIIGSNGNDYRLGFSAETNKFLNAFDKKVNTENYTDNFMNRFGFQIAAQNPSGPQNDGIVPPTQSDFEAILSRELGKSISIPAVTEKDIRIQKEENKETIIQYAQKLNTIISRANTASAKETKNISETNINDLGKTANALHTAVSDLLALEVPKSWVDFHIQTINVYERKAALLDALANLENDPIKTIVAAQELQNLGEQERQLGVLFVQKIDAIKS